jgi:anti-anti-sigma regulatory factor
MSGNGTSAIHVASTAGGFVARIEGWGTMRESPLLQEFACECLEGDPVPLVVDLADCTYLDSTFLGCLVGLHRRFSRDGAPQFLVAASAAQRQRLLAPLQLHQILKLIDEAPPEAGDWLTLCPADQAAPANGPRQAGRHILECHRRLAEMGGENEAVFAPIVAQLAYELQERATTAKAIGEDALHDTLPRLADGR